MIETRFDFRLRVIGPDRVVIHSEDVKEWGPAYEDMLLDAILEKRIPNDGSLPQAYLEPLSHRHCVCGFRLSLGGMTRDYSLGILADRVRQIVAAAMSAAPGGSEHGARYTWEVLASERASPIPARRIRARREPYPLLDARPGAERWPKDGTRLALSAGLAGELRRKAAESLSCERAHLLGGWVIKSGRGVTVLADRAYPVDNCVSATDSRIDFSPRSFTDAMRQLRLEGSSRTPVGWHHNHPPPCGGSCPMDAPACNAGSVFLSIDDRVVHRCYFGAPYMVAVVSGKGPGSRPDDPLQKAYGWTSGVLGEIGFTTFTESGHERL